MHLCFKRRIHGFYVISVLHVFIFTTRPSVDGTIDENICGGMVQYADGASESDIVRF